MEEPFMNLYSNEELVRIYLECKTELNNINGSSQNAFLLEIYHNIKNPEKQLGYLHYYMIKEIFEEVEKELAARYVLEFTSK
jgi:hypothetical protein